MYRSTGDEGTPKPKATPRKRSKTGGDADTPGKKTKTNKGGTGKSADAEGGDDEKLGAEVVVKQEAAEGEE